MAGPEQRDPAEQLPGGDPAKKTFTPMVLDKTVIAMPLLERLKAEQKKREKAEEEGKSYSPPLLGVVLDLNLEYFEGRDRGRQVAMELIERVTRERGSSQAGQGVNRTKTELSKQYVFAKLEPEAIRELVRLDGRTDNDDPGVLPHLARLPDRHVDHQVGEHREGRRRARLVLGPRRGHRLGGGRLWD
jgi:hypothetical protein